MNILILIPIVLLAIGILSLSISCFKAEKRIKNLERDVKILMEKDKPVYK